MFRLFKRRLFNGGLFRKKVTTSVDSGKCVNGKEHNWYLSVEPTPGVTAVFWFSCRNCPAQKTAV